ncbi:MAG: hypothetical protein H5U40_13335, partial [Polyangiaceae bacterium]|nr:hypothetical protein [Polyangiaceae bacterium]
APHAPGLLITEDRPRAPESANDAAFRWLPRSTPVSELRCFIGYSLALEVTQDPDIAAVVEEIGRARGLTVKQMELTALATTPLARDSLIEGLGVSQNTVKTRIRQLLRIHQEDSMDTLGKTVLRAALAHSRGTPWSATRGGAGAMPTERKALARPGPATKAVPRRARGVNAIGAL